MDAKTEELKAAHDVLAEFYADRLAGALHRMPAERAVLDLFCDLPPQGIDLSPGMIRVARRDQPGFDFGVADLRAPPSRMPRWPA